MSIRNSLSWQGPPSLGRLFPHPSMLLGMIALVGVVTARAHAGFLTAPIYPVGIDPRSVVVADLNGDGHPDLVVANYGGYPDYQGSVSVLLGMGDGTFQPAQTYVAGSHLLSLAVGDFNGDGSLDLVVAGGGAVSVLLGNGDGTFQAAQSYAAGTAPSMVTVGDFNGDGHVDLAVANLGSYPNDLGSVSVLLGNGDGTFQAAQNLAAGNHPIFVAVGDFNGDGNFDLVVANWEAPSTLTVLLGNGDGSFQAPASFSVDGRVSSVSLGDFNGDGLLDLVAANADAGTVRVWFGNGDGTFQPAPTEYAVGYEPGVAVADVNGDGRLDLVVASFYSEMVQVLLGQGDGSFQVLPIRYPYGPTPYGGSPSLAVGDLNGDGHVDAVIAMSGAPSYAGLGTVGILFGNGDGMFQDPLRSYATGPTTTSVAVGDFNGDGHLDLAVTNEGTSPNFVDGSVSILLGNGDGTFQPAQSYPVGASPRSVAVGDVNGDGIPDLAVVNVDAMNQGTVSLLLGQGDGTFQMGQTYAVGSSSRFVALADLNGDGALDLIVANAGSNSLSILLGNGDGTFRAQPDVLVGNRPVSVAVADFNGDGRPDLAVGSDGGGGEINGSLSILLGQGDGTFQTPTKVLVNNITSVAVGDLNGDGKLDLLVTDRYISGAGSHGQFFDDVRVFLGNGDGTFRPGQTLSTSWRTSVTLADVNGDGILDAVMVGVPDTVVVQLGNGDGTFRAAQAYPTGNGVGSLVFGDFNGDGHPDVVVTNGFNATLTVLLNAADWGP